MSNYPGYNPGQFQAPGHFPPPGGGGGGPYNPPPPMQPGQGFAPPPPGQYGGQPLQQQPGTGFASPPPPGQGGPPPPGATGMNMMGGLNAGMRTMNLGGPPPPQQQAPAIFQPAAPNMMSGYPPPSGGQHPQGPPAPGAPTFYSAQPAPPGQNQFAPQPPGPMSGQPQQPPSVFMESDVDYSNVIPPTMFRPTSTLLPSTASLASTCKVPTGGILCPFANPEEGEVNVITPGAAGIIRCKRCRTYVNAFVDWLENGRRWRCNICAQLNETPSAYFCHLDEKNQRRDKDQRPELSSSVVEWVAPSEYMVRAPQPPAFFFVFDVSLYAVQSGMLASAANAIKMALDDLPGGDRTMVGFITFDTAVHYYSLKPGSSNPQMMVVGDLQELFVPAPDDLLVYLKDSRAAVENLLDNLPTMFANNQATESCLGPALKAAFTVMKAIGGKMSVFQATIPTLGDGALKMRENPRLMGTPDEVKVLRPETTWYKDTAIEFSRAQISVDMYLFPNQYIDIASLSELATVTAGGAFSYPGFNMNRDGPKVESQLYRRLTQPVAFEAVLRIRCTKGMRISNFYGNFFIRGTDLLALPNCSADSVFGFDLVHDEQSINNPYVAIQSALLYTTSDGERRIRVATQVLKTTTKLSDFMKSVNAEACITLLAKQALHVGIKTNLDNARNRLQQMCVDMCNAAKGGDKRTVSGYAVPTSSSGQADEDVNIPENLQLLPLYTLALMKNVSLRGGTDVHPDERIAAHLALAHMFVNETLSFIHPRLYAVHNMDAQCGMPSGNDADDLDTAGRNKIILPNACNLSVDRLNSEGVFLLDNGKDAYIWVGRAANPAIVGSLFGVESLNNIDPSQVILNTSGNDLASRLGSVIQALHESDDPSIVPVSPSTFIIREGDMAMEGRFFWNFIEDGAQFNGGTFSYADFMEFVNRPPGVASTPGMPPSMNSGAPRAMPPPGQGMPPPMNMNAPRSMPPPGHGMPPPGQGMPPPMNMNAPRSMPPPGHGMPPPINANAPLSMSSNQGMPPPIHANAPRSMPPSLPNQGPPQQQQPPPPQQQSHLHMRSTGPPSGGHNQGPPPPAAYTAGPPPGGYNAGKMSGPPSGGYQGNPGAPPTRQMPAPAAGSGPPPPSRPGPPPMKGPQSGNAPQQYGSAPSSQYGMPPPPR